VLAFCLELAALAAFAVWGLHAGNRASTSLALAVAAPLIAAVVWGLFASPRASLSGPVCTPGVTVVFFASAALALCASGHPRLAAALLITVVINMLVLHVVPAGATPIKGAHGAIQRCDRPEPFDADGSAVIREVGTMDRDMHCSR